MGLLQLRLEEFIHRLRRELSQPDGEIPKHWKEFLNERIDLLTILDIARLYPVFNCVKSLRHLFNEQ